MNNQQRHNMATEWRLEIQKRIRANEGKQYWAVVKETLFDMIKAVEQSLKEEYRH